MGRTAAEIRDAALERIHKKSSKELEDYVKRFYLENSKNIIKSADQGNSCVGIEYHREQFLRNVNCGYLEPNEYDNYSATFVRIKNERCDRLYNLYNQKTTEQIKLLKKEYEVDVRHNKFEW